MQLQSPSSVPLSWIADAPKTFCQLKFTPDGIFRSRSDRLHGNSGTTLSLIILLKHPNTLMNIVVGVQLYEDVRYHEIDDVRGEICLRWPAAHLHIQSSVESSDTPARQKLELIQTSKTRANHHHPL